MGKPKSHLKRIVCDIDKDIHEAMMKYQEDHGIMISWMAGQGIKEFLISKGAYKPSKVSKTEKIQKIEETDGSTN